MKKVRNVFFIPLLLCTIVFGIQGCNTEPEGRIVYLENGKLKLGFDKNTGTLLVFKDLINSYEFLDTNITSGSLWELVILKSTGPEKIDMTFATKFNHLSPNPNTLVLEWSDFPSLENKELKVVAIVNLEEGKAMSNWSMSLEGTKGMEISQLAFPRIKGLKNIGDEYLAVPFWLGQLFHNPRESLREMQTESLGQSVGKQASYSFDYPGPLSLQLVALYDPATYGLYMACNDTAGYSKSFSFSLDADENLTYELINYPAIDADLDKYSPVYQANIGSFKGDWMTAAALYKEWGEKQAWCKNSRLDNDLVPPWLKKTALWVWNRGKSDKVLIPAIDLKMRAGLPVSVFWHWWHQCSYDDGFPEYLPPREGKKSFIAAMKKANDNDIRAIVYMNSFQWGTETQSWKDENAELYAVKDLEGNIRSHVYNIFTGKSLTNMCMGTKFWRNKYASLSDSVVNTYHTNGVYMDQACLSRKCYDKSHGHPRGGGNYWVNNFAELTDIIREKTDSIRQPVLAGEGCCEVWLPHLDAFLTLRVSMERFAGVGSMEPIPFYTMVYHKYGVLYGNYSSLIVPPYDELWPEEYAPKDPEALLSEDFNKQYLMEQARSFVWGSQPTISNYRNFLASKRKDEIDYLIELAKVRYQGLKYLLHGEMLRSPKMNILTQEIDISRLSIYAGKTGGSVTVFKKEVPLLFSGTWKAEDNNIGIALASISDAPFRINFNFNSGDYGLQPKGDIYVIDIEGKRLLSSYSDEKVQVNFSLPPKGLCIIEISSSEND
jgi:hypothetical protein